MLTLQKDEIFFLFIKNEPICQSMNPSSGIRLRFFPEVIIGRADPYSTELWILHPFTPSNLGTTRFERLLRKKVLNFLQYPKGMYSVPKNLYFVK